LSLLITVLLYCISAAQKNCWFISSSFHLFLFCLIFKDHVSSFAASLDSFYSISSHLMFVNIFLSFFHYASMS